MADDNDRDMRINRIGTGTAVVVLTALLQACSGPPLEPWHTEPLREEFETGAPEIVGLADYLALEERLFAELDDEVYGRVATGSTEMLVRYSRGSASDPSDWDPNWNRSFELPAESPVGFGSGAASRVRAGWTTDGDVACSDAAGCCLSASR